MALYVTNQAGGTVESNIEGNSTLLFGVRNAGEIDGYVFVNDTVPRLFTGSSIYYVDEGGTAGSVQLGTTGYSTANYILRASEPGTDTITAGNGLDIYTKSYGATQSVALGQYDLPETFELEGYEVIGENTTLTLTGTGETIILMGDGNVVNEAEINLIDTTTAYPVEVIPTAVSTYNMQFATYQRQNPQLGQPSIYTIPIGNELASFVNNGAINGDVRIATATFVNNGEINIASHASGTVIRGAADKDFLFRNTGTIVMTANGPRPASFEPEFEDGTTAAVRLTTAVDATGLNAVTIENGEDGLISGGLSLTGVASNFTFTNDGEIERGDNPFDIDRAVEINLGNFEIAQTAALREDAVSDNVTIINNGTLDGGIEAEVTSRILSFTNSSSGYINADTSDDYAAAVELSNDDWADTPEGEDINDGETFTFLNQGTIVGTVDLDANSSLTSFTNSGSITQALRGDHGAVVNPEASETVRIRQETTLDAALVFNNTGTISNADYASGAVFIELEAGELSSGLPAAADAEALVTIGNSGSIVASGGNYLSFPPTAGLSQGQIGLDYSVALAVIADGEGNGSVSITNEAGGLIDARGTAHMWTGSIEVVPNQPSDTGGMAIAVSADSAVTILNHGTIRGGPGGSLTTPNGVLVPINSGNVDFEGIWGGAIDTFGDSADSVINSSTGLIEGGIALRGGNDRFENYGIVDGDLYLGDGDDTFIQAWDATFTGIADGGAGTDTFVLDLNGSTANDTVDLAIYDQLLNFEVLETQGTGGGVSGGSGNDNVNNTGTLNGPVDLGEGDNTFTNSSGGTINNDVTAGSGSDVVQNQGAINGSVNLGGGDNTFTNAPGGTVAGNVQTGVGNDNIQNQGTIDGDVVLDGETAPSLAPAFVQTAVSPMATIVPTGGDDVLSNDGTVTGSIFAGAGNDKLTNSGIIGGDIDLGDGNDELVLESGWSIGGAVDGGVGTDGLQVTFGSTSDENPQILDFSRFTNFEKLAVNGGVGKVEGSANFDQIDIDNGRLIGAMGSTITGDVNVGSAGTFGSAGTVIGNVAVASGGTLSPGASPAVMTVIGDVSLAGGSITTFEFVPAPGQSDQLLIDGNLSIAPGAVLNLTGDRPLTPGTPYDMIVADSIDGEFTVGDWNKSAVQGFLRYVDGTTSDQLQLVGTFVAPSGTGPQAIAAVNYVNGLLISGDVSSALLDAIPVLLDADGYASSSAFGLLSPEPYATASQLGVEHGLSLSKAMRSGVALPSHDEARLFAFVSGFGNWRSLKSNTTLGTSRAKSDGYGLLGGLGFGNRNGSVAAFVGYVDSQQRIKALDSRTDADGMVAGLYGQLTAGGFNMAATIAYDWSDAQTDRSVPGGGMVSSSDYELNSLVLDATISYSLPVGANWILQPQAGLTHVSTKRGATSEIGSAAFALDVERKRTNATFADATVVLRGGQNAEATFEPWIQAGVRQQLDGKHVTATAGFTGMTETFTVFGAPRKATVMTAGAGFSARLADGIKIFASYQGEFGSGTGTQFDGGIQIKF
ncbi:hypothetical protein MB02_10665 [Croceicoccus estronivorus]|uniref:autotransporter domain-containing protein n=1 Tax=Croceicoccus estronivorus TaxID=1172626 RepID=UPI00082A520D|nr:autotransporter domain-containing protein [Croceicoccus estronivorus]OCC23624.1 hypothetical protein MB02_10665 [Croceicoccus estronivorus]